MQARSRTGMAVGRGLRGLRVRRRALGLVGVRAVGVRGRVGAREPAGVQVTPPRVGLEGTLTLQPEGQTARIGLGDWQRTPVADRPERRIQRRGQPVLGSSVCEHVTPVALVAGVMTVQARGQTEMPRGARHWRAPEGRRNVVHEMGHSPVEGARVGVPLRLRTGLGVGNGPPLPVGATVAPLMVGRKLGLLDGRRGIVVGDGGRVNWQGTWNGTPWTTCVHSAELLEPLVVLLLGHGTSTHWPLLGRKQRLLIVELH